MSSCHQLQTVLRWQTHERMFLHSPHAFRCSLLSSLVPGSQLCSQLLEKTLKTAICKVSLSVPFLKITGVASTLLALLFPASSPESGLPCPLGSVAHLFCYSSSGPEPGSVPPEVISLCFCQSPGGTDNLQTMQEAKLGILNYTVG